LRVELQRDRLVIHLAEPPSTLEVPWQKIPARRRCDPRRRWLDELIADPAITAGTIARRENCSVRKINMTISLAFLAPDLVKAAIDGRLP